MITWSFLNLKPKRFLCPCCEQWHVWDKGKLVKYDSECFMAKHRCSNGKGDFEICFTEDCCFYRIRNMCRMSELEEYIPIYSRIESEDKPIVTFNCSCYFITYNNTNIVCKYIDNCEHCNKCMLAQFTNEFQSTNKYGLRKMKIKFGFEFEQ